jgi:hypothetical protein
MIKMQNQQINKRVDTAKTELEQILFSFSLYFAHPQKYKAQINNVKRSLTVVRRHEAPLSFSASPQ